jgi:transposase IS116/IS110/IS902 family protein
MKFVATKTADQLDLQALHRVRERLVSQRTGIINQIRAFLLERGIAVRQGLHLLRAELPGILGTRTDVLSPRMLRVIEDLAGDWRRLDERIEDLSGEIDALAHHDKGCERLMTVPGVGPIISSAIVAAIGTGDAFSKGRDFGAWLGLVPKQMSTGDRTILGSISRRGNRYLRKLFVQPGSYWSSSGQSSGSAMASNPDRGRQEAPTPQCAGNRARQQARPHRLGRPPQGLRLRVRQDQRNSVPICLILAPCSGPVKAWPGNTGASRNVIATASLDRLLRAARLRTRGSGRRNGRQARTKEQHEARRLSMT